MLKRNSCTLKVGLTFNACNKYNHFKFPKKSKVRDNLKSPTIYSCTRSNAQLGVGNADTGSHNAGMIHPVWGRAGVSVKSLSRGC